MFRWGTVIVERDGTQHLTEETVTQNELIETKLVEIICLHCFTLLLSLFHLTAVLALQTYHEDYSSDSEYLSTIVHSSHACTRNMKMPNDILTTSQGIMYLRLRFETYVV